VPQESDIPKVNGTAARWGALWGAAIFLCLWLATLGTVGEILLLLPALWILGVLGVVFPGESILWRVVGAILSTAAFSFIGARYGPIVFSTFKTWPIAVRIVVSMFLAIMIIMIVLIGRHLTM